jgi:hypothetical protein
MRLLAFILLTLTTFPSVGQKLIDHKVDSNDNFPFEYLFKFQFENDSNSFNLNTRQDVDSSKIQLKNNDNETLGIYSLAIIDLDNGSKKSILTNRQGYVSLILPNGNYKIEINAVGFDSFETEIGIENNQAIDLDIKLGKAPDLTVYQINSKTELTKNKLKQIMNCVEMNKGESLLDCSEKDNFIVSMQI